MTAKSVLLHRQGLRPRARAPTCSPLLATPLIELQNFCYLASNYLNTLQCK